jgi:hypothetical protein
MILRIAIVAALLLSAGGASAAGIGPDDSMLWLNGGAVAGNSEYSGARINGPHLSIGYEQMDPEKPFSVGFNFGYLTVKDEGVAHPDTMTGRDISSAPLYLGGKGWLGKGTFQGYGGLALGVYITTTKTNFATKPSDTVVRTGFGMGVPIGFTISLGKMFALDFNYTLNWLWSNNAIQDNIVHSLNGGIGIKINEDQASTD